LFPDRAKAGQLCGDVLADLRGAPDQRGAVAGAVVHQQLRPAVPAEDRVLDPVPRGRYVEPLAIPVKPVRAYVRAAVAADPGDDDVAGLGGDALDLVGRCHAKHATGAPAPARLSGVSRPCAGPAGPAHAEYRGTSRAMCHA